MKTEIIWRDKNRIRITMELTCLILIIIFTILLFIAKDMVSRMIFLLLVIFSIIGLFDIFRRKLILVKNKGIFMNDIKFVNHNIKLKQTKVFINWELIENIKIMNHILSISYIGLPRHFVFIKTKGYTYRDILFDPNGFTTVLKKLNKYHLLDKNSKYK